MGFTLTYDIEGAGWAVARIQDGEKDINITVSYLHDSLRDLAEAARALADGAQEARVVFMDEPGEMHLVVETKGDSLSYQLKWFDDWNSWEMHPENKFQVVHSGSTTKARIIGEIRKELEAVLKDHGMEGYKEKWVEHPFPVELLRELQNKEANQPVQPTSLRSAADR